MDVRISDGDIAMLSSGSYEYITGIEEAVQRVRISALTVKGDFIYDRELGTDYSGLSADDPLLLEKLDLLIKELGKRLADKQLSIRVTDEAKAYIADNGYDPIYGARPLKRYLQSHVETLLARKIIAEDPAPETTLVVDMEDNALTVTLETPNG